MLYFPDEKATDFDFYGEEIAALSQSSALFIKIPYTADRVKSPWVGESVIPVSKLLGDNPSRDYNVPTKGATVIVCDWHGNDYFRTTGDAKADALKKLIDQVSKKADEANKKLERTYAKAEEAHGKSDAKGALKHLLSNFKGGVVGLPAQESSVRLYHQIMDGVRKQAEEMRDNGDETGLKGLAKDYKGTDASKDIDEALKNVGRNPSTQNGK